MLLMSIINLSSLSTVYEREPEGKADMRMIIESFHWESALKFIIWSHFPEWVLVKEPCKTKEKLHPNKKEIMFLKEKWKEG